jgi:hypothetical protein
MDRGAFDTLARLVSHQRTRRRAIATLLGAALLGHDPAKALGKRRRAGKVKAQAKAKAKTQPPPCYPGGTTCSPGKGKNTSGCDFSRSTVFHNKDVRGSNLSNSSFVGADLRGADFRGANMSGSCLVGADLTGAKLGSSVNQHEAIFCNTIMPNGTRNNSGCEGATPCCHRLLQDCADGPVDCYQPSAIGTCGAFMGSLGQFGHCWQIFTGCCPCDHPREAKYWNEQCNQKFPGCNNKCIADDGIQYLACFACPSDDL